MRLVEVLNVLSQQLEILTALFEAVHLPRGFLREIVDLREPLVERFERQLLPGQVVGLCEQGLEPLRDRVDLLRQRVDVLVFRPERVHPRFSVADRCGERPETLVERLELLLFQSERIDLAAH